VSAWSDVTPALVGVVIGAGLSFVTGLLADRTRWRRDQSVRWDERRLAAYFDYGNAVKEEVRICLRLAANLYPKVRTVSIDPSEGRAALARAEDRRSNLFEGLLLLGDKETVAAARAWQGAVWELHYLVEPGQASENEFLAGFKQCGTARDNFYIAARRDLGITTDLHTGAEWTWPSSNQRLPF
jgi:hypothetical protein